MKFEQGHVYHVYNQGNNHQPVFITHHDYVEFLNFSKVYIAPYCDILAWCLLPNHFHFMIIANEKASRPHQQGNLLIDNLTNGFRKLISGYSHQFNKRNQRTGSLFRAKTKSKDLTAHINILRAANADYYLNCFYYIHQNPLRHHLVTDLIHWKYSSFAFYADIRKKDFCNKQLAKETCEYDIATFVNLVNTRLPDSFLAIHERDIGLL